MPLPSVRLWAIRTAFRTVGVVAPGVAARWAETLFCTPPPRREGDEAFIATGTRFTITSQGQQLAGWQWGEGPTVVLVHGWGSRASRMRGLARALVGAGFRVVAYDAPAPPSLWSLAPPGVVLRMGSFSKSLAPGLRLGWLTGGSETIMRMAKGGLLDSGGGINHFMALVVAELCAGGDFDAQVEKLRAAYRAKRDALMAAFARHLPAGCTWQRPGGGFFAWV